MSEVKYKLNKKIIIKGKITALTGLLIGGTNTSLAIGGPDKMVIRNPLTNKPYIPGSSLKGKMRSLLELSYGYVKPVNMGKVKWGVNDDISKETTQLFGNAPKDEKKQRPSRIIVRDGNLINAEYLESKPTDLPYTETKTEVVIDRITSAAMPRTFERVPAGAEFELNLVLNIFDDKQLSMDNEGVKPISEQELLKQTFKALQMVQDDYLGGAGSRGSGQVSFKITEIVERSAGYYKGLEGDAGKENIMNIKDHKDKLINYGVPTDLLD
jgi:CRISPR-associated protein Csm3